MRVVVVGATGNVGTSVLHALGDAAEVDSVLGVARRAPKEPWPKVEWARADITQDDLRPLFRDADAVVHLAWRIQPSRDRALTRAVNVDGSARVFRATADAGVTSLVYASSVGAYSPGPKDRRVDESWPTEGVQSSFYGRDKAAVERLLDRFELERPGVRVVRLRPGLCFKHDAAAEIRRLFAGPFLPSRLVRPGLIPIVPDVPGLRFQAVHSDDVGEAYRLAVAGDARGAFNVAADPVLDPPVLARLLGARRVRVPARVVRAGVSLAWRARLSPTPPGWVDLALQTPLMDVRRAREELGWSPRHDAGEALLSLLAGLRHDAGLSTPPLDPRTGGRFRAREFATGVGAR